MSIKLKQFAAGFLLFISTFWIASAWGQEALTRERAIELALERNYALKLVRLQADQSIATNSWGAAGALPRLSFSASPSKSVSDQSENPTSFLQQRIESSGFNLGAQANWTLFDGFGMFANKRSLELLEAQAGGEVDLMVEQTVQAVLQAYDAVLVQEALLDVLAWSLRFSREQINWLEIRESSGAAGSFDRLQFENAMLSDSMAWMQQEGALRMAQRNLNRLMAEEEEKRWELSSPLTEPSRIADVAAMEEAMRSSETAIRNALLGEALAQTSMDQAASRLYPVLAFTANFGDQFNAISAGAFSGDARVKNTSAALTLNFNLFNGGATKRALDQAAIQMDLAITASENQVAASLLLFRNAVDQFETQQAIHGMAKATVVNAEQLVSIAGDRYAFGALNSLEVRQLQLNLLRAEVNQLQVLQSWNSAWLDLQRLSGNLRPARLQSPGY